MVHHLPINRRYKIINQIGEGGMGTVYHAWDRLTQSSVALKSVKLSNQAASSDSIQTAIFNGPHQLDQTIHYEETASETLLTLAHEFQILSTLRHPNIISVIDYGFNADGAPFFTMDYLDDALPIDEVGRHAPLDTQIKLIAEILLALTYLHRRDILHRDLKPGNVLYSQGKTKVLDFGLSNLKNQTHSSGGTLAYLSPELLRGHEATVASDLYAVGVIAFEILAGLLPFEPSRPKFLLRVLEESPEFDFIDAPKQVINVIGKLLAKNPRDRYVSAEAALQALCRAAGRAMPAETIHIRESFLQAATFTGREKEAGIVSRQINQTRYRTGSSILIAGESGVGKSRLIRESKTKALVEGLLVLEAQVTEEEGIGFAVWEGAIERLALEIDLDDHTISVLKPIAPNLETILERKVANAPILPEDLAEQRLIAAILSLFERLERGAMIIVEDLHWYQGGVSFLNKLIDLSRQHPIIFLGSFRDDEAPRLQDEIPAAHLIRLERFSSEDIASLSHAMLGEVGLKPEIQKLLMEESEGNVFFLVEIVRHLAEIAGQLSLINQEVVPDNLLPHGIQAIVANRIQQIPAEWQNPLKFIATAGREVDVKLVNVYLETFADIGSTDHFLTICNNAAILEVYNDQWRFSHDKIRQGVLASIEPDELPAWHESVASHLVACYIESDRIAEKLVYHWHLAKNSEKEREAAIQAAGYHKRIFENERALDLIARALALTSDNDFDILFTSLRLREEIYRHIGKRAQQAEDIHQLEHLAQLIFDQGGADFRPEISLRHAHYFLKLGNFTEAIEFANITKSLIAQPKAGNQAYEATYLTGEALIRMGEYQRGCQILTDLIDRWDSPIPQEFKANTFYSLGYGQEKMGLLDEAERSFNIALEMYQKQNDRVGESKTLTGLGVLYDTRQAYRKAAQLHTEVYTILVEIGDIEGQAKALTNICLINISFGQFQKAIDYGLRGLSLAISINSIPGKLINLINLMLIHCYIKDQENSAIFRSLVTQFSNEIDIPYFKAVSLSEIGYTYLAEQEYQQAFEFLSRAASYASHIGNKSAVAEIELNLAYSAWQLGSPQEAEDFFQTYLSAIEENKQFFIGMIREFFARAAIVEMLSNMEQSIPFKILTDGYQTVQRLEGVMMSEEQREDWVSHYPGVKQFVTLYKLYFVP